MSNSIPLPTQYVESLDSVRFDSPAERDANEAQARLDLALALCYGQRLALSEPMACDSRALLNFFHELLDVTRPVTIPHFREPSTAGSSNIISRSAPVFVALRQPGGLAGCAARLLGNPDFKLSAWPMVQSLGERRVGLGDHLRRPDGFDRVKEEFGADLGDDLTLLEHLKELVAACDGSDPSNAGVASAFTRDGIGPGWAAPVTVRLWQYMRWLMNKAPEPFAELVRHGRELQDLSDEQLDSRSSVRTYAQKRLGDESTALIEYVDTCYNQVVYEAVGASALASSTPIGADQDRRVALELGQVAATYALDELLKKGGEGWERPLRLVMTGAPAKLSILDPKRLRELFDAREWAGSAATLRNALNGNSRTAAEDALAAHTDLLRQHLTDWELTTQGGALSIRPKALVRHLTHVGAGMGAEAAIEAGFDVNTSAWMLRIFDPLKPMAPEALKQTVAATERVAVDMLNNIGEGAISGAALALADIFSKRPRVAFGFHNALTRTVHIG